MRKLFIAVASICAVSLGAFAGPTFAATGADTEQAQRAKAAQDLADAATRQAQAEAARSAADAQVQAAKAQADLAAAQARGQDSANRVSEAKAADASRAEQARQAAVEARRKFDNSPEGAAVNYGAKLAAPLLVGSVAGYALSHGVSKPPRATCGSGSSRSWPNKRGR